MNTKGSKRWQRFERATNFRGALDNLHPSDLRPQGTLVEIWVNNLYQVHVTKYPNKTGGVDFIHLSFKSQDGTARHDWRDMQRIKNELAGEDWMGVELYPPEKQLVDTSNQFHIWCFRELEAPFAFQERLVTESPFGPYGTQRPWPEDEKPEGLKSGAEMAKLIEQTRKEVHARRGQTNR